MMVRMRRLLWLCAGTLALTVGTTVARGTQDRNTVRGMAFARYTLVRPGYVT